jgi:hypothetical protein
MGKLGSISKNGGRIEIQPRFKIQYPMKNRCKHNGHFINKTA